MSALGEYYRAQTQEKIAGLGVQDAQRLSIQAQTAGTNANTGEIAANAAATRGVQSAQAGLLGTEAFAQRMKLPGQIDQLGAQTALTTAQAGTIGPLAQSEISSRAASANLANTTAGIDRLKLPGTLDSLSASTNLTDAQAQQARQQAAFGSTGVLGFAKGTSRVPGKAVNKGVVGKGKPSVHDTVPAMLAPGEAVLNRGAAEHMGRGVIDHLNHHGLLRMAAQHEVSQHVAHHAAMAGPKGKPKAGTVMHFLTGGMVPGQPGAAPGQGPDLLSMLAAVQGSPAAGGGAGAPAPSAVAGGPPAAPAPRARHKGKR